ncbi:MAG: DUF4105 domain-containing protein [Planctomycetota bacterium]|nr:DUF4105 domain-containing protein [Planctomycetota bacterium]
MTHPDSPSSKPLPIRATIGLSRLALWMILAIVILVLGIWATMAIRFSNLPTETFRLIAAGLYPIGWLFAFIYFKKRLRTALAFMIVFAGIVVWWNLIPPSHDRDWTTDVAVLPHISWEGDRFTVHDLRAFEYRSEEDYDVHYVDHTYDMNEIAYLDFVMSDWGLHEVVHTMLSFGFTDGEHLVLSIESRREQGEAWSGLKGLFHQAEVIYVLAGERDLLGLRTNMRKEDVYVIPTIHPPEKVKLVLQSVLETVDAIAKQPRWYNTLLHNCTTGLLPHLESVRVQQGFDMRMIKNGYIAEIGFENGTIDTDLSYKEAGQYFHINQYVPAGPIPDDFSKLIRPYRYELDDSEN